MTKQLQKKLAAFIVSVMMFCATTQAQWLASGANIYNTNAGKVGIGTGVTTVPSGILTVKGAGSVPAASWVAAGAPLFTGFGENAIGNADYILAMASTSNNGRPVFVGRRSRGTLAAPTALVNNDFIMSMLASGYDGAAFQNPSTIDFYVDGVPTAGNIPTRISFVTGSNSGNRAERLKIGSTGDISFNTNQLFVQKTTGNVGIGTNTPSVPLDVKSASGFIGRLNGGSGMYLGLYENDLYRGYLGSYAGAAEDVDFGTGGGNATGKLHLAIQGSPKLTVDASGKVGIGTTTPASLLHINGGDLFVQSSSGTIRLGYQGSNEWQMATTNGGADLLWATTTNGGTTTKYNHYFRQNGDVGIGGGAITPTARLDVTGDTTSFVPIISATANYTGGNTDVKGVQSTSVIAPGYGYGVYSTGGYMGGRFIANSSTYAFTSYGVYGSASGSTAGTRIGVYGSASGAATAEANWGGYFPTKTYTNELRVGGTQGATGYVAAINGKLIATEVKVDLIANWPDYVFGKDHKLLPLEDLEASINANKHLPGIPSAAEVKESGIVLGEMQTKTMEKVEENTLYIIELNKKIKMLEEKIEKLTNAIK